MNAEFTPEDIERAAQSAWSQRDAYRVAEDSTRPKFYACSMLPYPSGKLHMGHVRNYTINDMMARYLRMKGYNVLMPMGWDAFGLPAENAAIDKNVRAGEVDARQHRRHEGADAAAGPGLRLVARDRHLRPELLQVEPVVLPEDAREGHRLQKTQVVNWDPVDQTVLANEQVDRRRGWRSGAPVEKREIPGYYLAITQYADELLANVADPAARLPAAGPSACA
jgi:leucyl-tRNA synthetase